MAKPCKFCEHPDRQMLETALLRREKTQQNVADLLGVTKPAVSDHARKHIPAAIRMAISQGKATQAGLNVMCQLIEINQEAWRILEEARGADDQLMALRAIERVEKQLELQAKLLGQIQAGVTVNVNQAPVYVEFRTMILNLLNKYPEVKANIVQRLKDENTR